MVIVLPGKEIAEIFTKYQQENVNNWELNKGKSDQVFT